MGTLFFYLLILLLLAGGALLFLYRRKRVKKNRLRKRAPVVDFSGISIKERSGAGKRLTDRAVRDPDSSPYDPSLVVLQLNAFPGQPYMGYELHQSLLDAGFRFGEKNIFHRYEKDEGGKVLFSLAAATPTGEFDLEDFGRFSCNGLLVFMRLDAKRKMMATFDLMLDTARQLTEELGGDIYDDLQQPLSSEVIKRMREKICTIETGNPYSSDLLDNLD